MTHTEREAAFDAACVAYRAARRAYERSRSNRNREALLAAERAHQIAAAECRAEQTRRDRALAAAFRASVTTARRTARAAVVRAGYTVADDGTVTQANH